MCERCLSVSAVYFILVTIVISSAFNLNWNYAPVFKDSSPGSYFGYSVAFRRKESEYKLLVGAPKGRPKLTDTDFGNQFSLQDPGVVFQCNLKNGWDCSLSKIETGGNKPQGNEVIHKRDHSMFGGTLAVSDDERRTVVCAPKWKNSFHKTHYLMNGICYCSDNPDDYKSTQYLMPLIRTGLQGVTDTTTNEIIFYYAFGEAGFSVHFPKNSSDLILGAPGIFDWKGAVIRYKGDSFDYNRRIPSIPRSNYVQAPQITPTIKDGFPSLGRNNYLGYAVASGRFSRSNTKTLYVSSAPRADFYRGKVYIFDFVDDDVEDIVIKNIFEGKQMGEYFGASLCVADINGDGIDDLIVGAPQHSLTSLNAAQVIGDEGCIYVYIAKDHGEIREVTGENKIMGRRVAGARFGTAVANIGDLNYDGAEDIAVGAPYEGNGVVYIYHGRKTGTPLELVQIIQARDIDPFIKGLGISFSKGLDIDGNYYKDIAAGAYESGHAVLLRGHPIITLTSTLTSDVKKITNKTNSFTLTACLQYDAKYPPGSVDVIIGIKVDTVYGRARIEDSSDTSRNYTETLVRYNNKCRNIVIKIKGENKDASKPVDVTMTYDLKFNPADQKPISPSSPNRFCRDCPVLDFSQTNSKTIKVPFETGCKTLVCKPDLEVNAMFTGVKDNKIILGEQQTLEMLVEVINKGEPAYLPEVTIVLPAYTPLVRYPQNCQNAQGGNKPDKHVLNCNFGNALSGNKTIKLQMDLKDVPTKVKKLEYELNTTSSGEEATPDDNHKSIALDVDVLFDMTITGVSSREQVVYVAQNNSILKELNVTHKFEVWNLGPTRVDTATIMFEIPYYYYINSNAKAIVGIHKEKSVLHYNGNSELIKCDLDPKYSYYQERNYSVYENSSLDGSKGEAPESFPQNQTITDIPLFRRKRSAESSENKNAEDSSQNKTLLINCGDGSNKKVDCARITCTGGPFYANKSRAIIEIPLTIINLDSLGSVLESKDMILFSTVGTVNSDDPDNEKQPIGHRPDTVVVQTTLLGKLNMSDGGIPTWIIAVAIICGLLILSLIAMALHKMGFFKRAKKDELEALKEAEAEADADE